jgi:hypothetical protein
MRDEGSVTQRCRGIKTLGGDGVRKLLGPRTAALESLGSAVLPLGVIDFGDLCATV